MAASLRIPQRIEIEQQQQQQQQQQSEQHIKQRLSVYNKRQKRERIPEGANNKQQRTANSAASHGRRAVSIPHILQQIQRQRQQQQQLQKQHNKQQLRSVKDRHLAVFNDAATL